MGAIAFALLAAIPAGSPRRAAPGRYRDSSSSRRPATLNPDVTVGAPDVLTGCMLYDGLVRFAEGFRIVPSLAKAWEISADGLSYTFHLVAARGATASPVTSQDVKFTLLEVSSKFGSKFVAPGKAIKEIETPDPLTVVIRLSKPFGPFLFSLRLRAERGHPCHAHVVPRQRHPEKPGIADHARHPGSVPARQVGARRSPGARSQSRLLDAGPALPRPHHHQDHSGGLRAACWRCRPARWTTSISNYFPLSAHDLLAKNPRFSLKEVSYPSVDLIILTRARPPSTRPRCARPCWPPSIATTC